MNKSKYRDQSEIKRAFNVFDALNKKTKNAKKPSKLNEDLSQAILTMSSLGNLGRFGNQLFQYAFLKICAKQSGSKVECPPWIGQSLFGHQDPPVSHRLPPAIERRDVGENLFDVVPEFIPYVEKLADAESCRIGAEALEHGLENVDIWGFFQINTRFYEPYKEYFKSLFQPVEDLKSPLENGLNIIRSKGKTIVGIHIRRGDFITLPQAGFTFVVPSKWWYEWLEGIWNELEEPVLFLCSDELDKVVHDFDKFNPITSKDLLINLPGTIGDLNLEFYIDFFMLSRCDVVGISNSNFSFVACMLNEHGKLFVRPSLDFSTKFVSFDPWDSEPILYFSGQQPKIGKSLADIWYITYTTLGLYEAIKSISFYYPKEIIKGCIIRAYLGYKAKGFIGVIKSLLYTFGCRFVYKKSM